MMKGKSWTPSTLKEVGGSEGVGGTFLEETFSAATAPPEHRYHQKAARAVLKALLPGTGTDIKGHMRSHAELLEASGYASRLQDFDDLIRILDREIRLITPTDPEGQEGENDANARVQAGEKYYQLTHDYLVHSLRDWLTRKQKETRRGRAELRLVERAALWNAKPENRHLPAWWEWANIRLFTRKKTWTLPQRKMMGKTGKYFAVRWFLFAGIVTLSSWGLFEGLMYLTATNLVAVIKSADTNQVPQYLAVLEMRERWTTPLLRQLYEESAADSKERLHASLALSSVDPGQIDYLYERLLRAEPQVVVAIRDVLGRHQEKVVERLWSVLENQKNNQDQRFRAACALALYAPDDLRWENVNDDVAAKLVTENSLAIAKWVEAFRPIRRFLLSPLASFIEDDRRSGAQRNTIANVYGTYAADVPDAYARLEKQLDEKSDPDATVDAKIALAKRQASIGVTLLVMGRGEKVWPLFEHRPDPTLRSYLIDRVGPDGVDAKVLISRLDEEKEVSARRGIILSLGEYGLDRLGQYQRQNLLPRLLELYRDDPDPGIHGAAEWLLRHWQAADQLQEIDKELAQMASPAPGAKRHWYINRQGQTMMVVLNAGEFWMGTGEGGDRNRQQIGRSFAIASKEVTVEQFLNFRKGHVYSKQFSPSTDCPVNYVSWYDAAAYCNWLSEQEGIPKEQWCYVPNEAGQFEAGMKKAASYLQRTGYRVPTEAEWEYACRAGAETGYSFGEAGELLGKYAWHLGNSLDRSQPVGRLRPNDLGLFDMHGNAGEWTHEVYRDESRVLRGGSFLIQASFVRSGIRNFTAPALRSTSVGFRPVRTLPP
jgi:eukaryotic-like serine/threonine-protein kinase